MSSRLPFAELAKHRMAEAGKASGKTLPLAEIT
jgi:hypothetical protein